MKKKDIDVEFVEVKKEHKWRSRFAKVGICILALIGGLATTYFLVPNRIVNIDLGMPDEPGEEPETYFSRFVSKLTSAADENTVEELPTLSANIENLEIKWPNNDIKIGGNLMFSMKSLKDLNLSLDLDIDYNERDVDLALAYVDKTVYLALQDLRLKQSFVETEDVEDTDIGTIYEKVIYNFFSELNENGLQMNFNIGEVFNSLLGGFDLSSLVGGDTQLKVEEKEEDDHVNINLEIGLAPDQDPIKLGIVLGTETLDIRKVDLGTIKVGDVEISGLLNCEMSPELKILGLDHPEYKKQRGKFTEIISYSHWIDKIFNLLKTRQVGLDINADLKLHENEKITSLGYAELSADLDASELFDLSGFDLMALINGTEKIDSILLPDGVEDTENKITGLLNKFDFNVGLKLGNYPDGIKTEYSNINLAYYTNNVGHNAGYLTLNEEDNTAVMKAKIDVQTINFLIEKIPHLINSIKGDEPVKKDAPKTEEAGFFDFIINSDLIAAIEDGHYEGIIDMLKTLKSNEKTIEIVVNLAPLGFGENSEVALILDATESQEAPTKVISITAKNVRLNNLEVNAEIYTRPYSKNPIEKVDAIADTYDSLDFVPGVFNQVEQIIHTKQAGVHLSGDILDEKELGFNFDGWAQLDYGENIGFGSILFNQFKDQKGVVSNDHKVDISIDNRDGDHAKNNLLFQYGNPTLAAGKDPLRGRFTLQTFDDIIDLVMGLLQQNDRRFMKFFDDILVELRGCLIAQVISSKDYISLSKSSLIKDISQSDNGNKLDIVITDEIVPLDLVKDDLHLQIEFKKNALNERELKSIHIIDLDLGEKKVNVHIDLDEYNADLENPVKTSAEFMDFSDIAVLLQFGINSMELNYYHLTGQVKASALAGLINISLSVDFHIYVNGEITKIYGRINDIPNLDIFNVDTYAEFVFEPNHDVSGNDIGGYFYIVKTVDNLTAINDTEKYFKSDSKNFLDNILDYLLSSMIGIDSGLVDNLMKSGSDSGSEESVNSLYQNMFTSTGFQYSHTDTKDVWKVGVDLGVLTGKGAFSALEATIDGTYVDGRGYFTTLSAETNIIRVLKVTAKLNLIDPNPAVESWPSNINTRYEKIIKFYDTLSEKNKVKAYNDPSTGYTASMGTIDKVSLA